MVLWLIRQAARSSVSAFSSARAASTTSGSGRSAPDKEAILKLVREHSKKLSTSGSEASKKGWQVKAATWVKKLHVDRGDVKVGLHSTTGTFHIIDSLKPRYVVPDLTDCKLKPYVMHYEDTPAPSAKTASSEQRPDS